MNESEYSKVRAVRSSHLKALMVSPAHYLHEVHEEMRRAESGENNTTEALLLGSVTHCLVLEQSEFDARYMVYDPNLRPFPAQTFGLGENKNWKLRKEAEARNSGRELVHIDLYNRALAMKKAIKITKLADEVLNSVGIHEELHVWDDKYTGVKCKIRIDKRRKKTRGVDLKTTRDARPSKFVRDVFNLGYNVSAAFYMMGAELTEFMFVAVENEAPHGVLCYPVHDEVISAATVDIRGCLKTIKHCREEYGSEYDFKTVWPSYHFEHVDGFKLHLPTWYKNQVGLNMEYQG